LSKAFNDLLNRLEISFQRQKRFVADASHELRTPLAIVQGYTQMLARWAKDNPELLDESIQSIQQETQNMTAMIEQLLFWAKGDEQTITISKSLISVQEILQHTVTQLLLVYPERTVNLDIEPDLFFPGEPRMISRLVRILLDNSMKYTNTKKAITLKSWSSKHNIFISIHDEGEGIPENQLDKIFDRFYKADSSRTRKKPGFGLGLPIAKEIVELHNGTITVYSKIKEGTTFTATFPRNISG